MLASIAMRTRMVEVLIVALPRDAEPKWSLRRLRQKGPSREHECEQDRK